MTIFITGGLGFIGTNVAESFLADGEQVIILDNLSRRGTEHSLRYLQEKFPSRMEFIRGDIRRPPAEMFRAVSLADAVVHLAGQVAVTSSVLDPRADFETNALGTFNVLEVIRESGRKPLVIDASTNKVYGKMENYRQSWEYGVGEDCPLDFHSPYGCSKGAADQYVRDYARIYGIPTVVFRQSCIYGPHQFGMSDQGWVAWFAIAAMLNKPITIYGDGTQVRDVLFVDDLVNLYKRAISQPNKVSGKIFNIGGGPGKTLSLLQLLGILEKRLQKKIPVSFGDWRAGDQKVYISDIRRASVELDWQPSIGPEKGVERLLQWVSANQQLFSRI